MKTKRLTIALLTLLFASTGVFCSAKTPEEIAKEIAPLISENTICVVHFDIATLEPEQMTQNLKALCNTIRNAVAFDEALSKEINRIVPQDDILDMIPGELSKALQHVRKDCGVTEFYYLVTFPFEDCIVVPIREGVKTEFFDERVFVNFKGYMIFPNIRGIRHDSPQNQQKEAVARMFGTGFVPVERPELVEGLKLAGDRPVRAVAFPPTYAKTLLTSMMPLPQMPEPFDTLDVGQVFDALQLLAGGFDPNTMQATLIVKSKDQNTAASFRELVFSLPDKITQMVKAQPEFEAIGIPMTVVGNVLKQNADFLLPPPQDGKITIQLPGDALSMNIAKVLESITAETKAVSSSPVNQSKTCMNHLKVILLAMHNYNDSMRQLPAAFTTDSTGKPLHSWRVALLPFLEQAALYEQIRRNEPWDSEWNKQFHDKCPQIYQCPTMSDEEKAAGLTSYSLVVGRDTYPKQARQSYFFNMITDGTSNTIAVVERQMPINWMCPDQELTQEEAFLGLADPASGLGLRHENSGKKGLNVAVFDGSVQFIGDDIKPATWKALLTRAGGETVSYP